MNNTIDIINRIFNKIPHIYSELFLNIFSINYSHFSIPHNYNILEHTLSNLLNNNTKIYSKLFIRSSLLKDLESLNIKNRYTLDSMVIILSNNPEIDFLINIIDKKDNQKLYQKIKVTGLKLEDRMNVYILFDSYLISKVLIKTVHLLTAYKLEIGAKFYQDIHSTVEKYRTPELNFTHILDEYKEEYTNKITPNNFEILIYLLSLAKNGQDLEKNCHYEIKKLLISIGYSTKLKKIINYKRGSDYLEIINNNNLFNYNYSNKISPYIYENISTILKILFKKYHDDYNFIIEKDNILKKIFYLYISHLDFKDKIIICKNYKLWEYEWDSLKEEYQTTNC